MSIVGTTASSSCTIIWDCGSCFPLVRTCAVFAPSAMSATKLNLPAGPLVFKLCVCCVTLHKRHDAERLHPTLRMLMLVQHLHA
jgi:hypothetical protein